MYMAHTNIPGPSFSPHHSSTNFQVSDDFFEFNEYWTTTGVDDVFAAFSSLSAGYNYSQHPNHTPNDVVIGLDNNCSREGIINRDREKKKEMREKVAFITKSEVEILDDGFKWRKYGKKMVKNSPNPRNYYKCSVEGCSVKKRVERGSTRTRESTTTLLLLIPNIITLIAYGEITPTSGLHQDSRTVLLLINWVEKGHVARCCSTTNLFHYYLLLPLASQH
ncbi:UNVERIFIED_CONTAM: putative WRKY transcription factor 50 [Sesamum radiatum]|uniref:WRKY transcription factor 50 n=1 Tax=Sesamum radiatum TaxID=300843 RepID=A0AAW2L0U3_SESRA